MKFEKRRFSKRFPEIECAIFVVHEPPMPKIAVPKDEFPYVENRSVHRGTAAALILPDGRFWIGVCLCSPSDEFVKATGRAKAIGRAFVSMGPKTQQDGWFAEAGKIPFDVRTNQWATADLKDCLQVEIIEAKKKCGVL